MPEKTPALATTTRGPYAKTAQVRERILAACTEVFAESGYRATTMKEVAKRAAISERGLAHHFNGKAELLAEVLKRRERRGAERTASQSGLAALEALVDIVDKDSGTPGMVELHSLLSAEAASAEHPAHDHYVNRYEQARRFTIEAFEVLHTQGNLDSPLTPAQLGAAYLALSDGLQLQWLYNRDAVRPTEVLRAFLESVVRGL